MRRLAFFLFVLLILAGAVLAADFLSFSHRSVLQDGQTLVYEVVPGASFSQVARDFQDKGLIERPSYWNLLARFENQAGRIKAGEYRLEGPLTPGEVLDQLVQGNTLRHRLTLPEGWTFRQVLRAVQDHSKIARTLDEEDAANDLMAQLDRPGDSPEGWFYPDTYTFPAGTTDVEFLARAHRAMQQRLEREWRSRDSRLPLETPYEALILASIVERETGLPEERSLIAAVFLRRLELGMRLQTDPAVIYGLGEHFDGNLRRDDLRGDSPYNTYVHTGLPPTPIAMPGGDALHAVLHPADTQALYFVSRGDGSHVFSETYEQHRKAVIEHQLGGDAKRYNTED